MLIFATNDQREAAMDYVEETIPDVEVQDYEDQDLMRIIDETYENGIEGWEEDFFTGQQVTKYVPDN